MPNNSDGNSELRRHLKYLAGLSARTDEVGSLLDIFLVLAILTILIVRIFLQMTGYPQIGAGKIHFAHLLWGGLLMMAGLILMQSIITRGARRLGAVLGGIGFGLFIDELGKFITKDNDYFYQPTMAILYVLFIVFYLSTKSLLKARGLSPKESLINAIEYLKEAVTGELDANEKAKAILHAERSNGQSPMAPPIKALIERLEAVAPPQPFFWQRIARRIHDFYFRWASTKAFARVLAIFFLATAIFLSLDLKNLYVHFFKYEDLSFMAWAVLISSTITTVLILGGDVQLLRRQRLSAYLWFDRALLVSILVSQVLVFAQVQLKGILNLALLLVLLVTVRYLIREEKRNLAGEIVGAVREPPLP